MSTIKKDFKYRANYPLVPDEMDFASGVVFALVLMAVIMKVIL